MWKGVRIFNPAVFQIEDTFFWNSVGQCEDIRCEMLQ